MTQVLIQKPSPIHNLSYVFLGYYLSLLITFDLNLSYEQRITFIAMLGSFVGTLIYYIKPIERTISLYFRMTKTDATYPDELVTTQELVKPVFKSGILYSRYLQDERTMINGAFFLSIGISTSYKLLESIGLSNLYWYLQIFTVALICVGIWDIHILISRKMPILVFFFNYYNFSKNIPELIRAIESKDWIQAEKIIEKEPHLTEPELYATYYQSEEPRKGICPKCRKIKGGTYCIECGEKIVKICLKCGVPVLRTDEEEVYPTFCRYCGAKIEVERKTQEDDENL